MKGINPSPKKKRLTKKPNLNMLSDTTKSINEAIQKKINDDVRVSCINALNSIHTIFEFSKMDLGYSSSRITFIVDKTLDLKRFKEAIKERMEGVIITSIANNLLFIEINNRFRELLTLKSLIMDTDGVPLIKEIDGEVISFDFLEHEHMIISGDKGSGITTFVEGIIASSILRNYQIEIALYDYYQTFTDLKGKEILFGGYNDTNISSLFDKVSYEIEKRLELFKYLSVSNIKDANEALKLKDIPYDEIKYIYFIINGFDQKEGIESKILYISQLGSSCGIHIILINRDTILKPLIKNAIPLKIMFHSSDIRLSLDILESDEAMYLENKGEVIIHYQDKRYRGQTGFITHLEYLKVISY